MTSTERESEQGRQLREGVRVVQLATAPVVPLAVRHPDAPRHFVQTVMGEPLRDYQAELLAAAVRHYALPRHLPLGSDRGR